MAEALAPTIALPAPARRIAAGTVLAPRTIATAAGASVPIPDGERLVHLQFRRFAGCPICNIHLRSLVRREAEIAALGIREIVVFHSRPDELAAYVPDMPFALVADPAKRLYVEFGVEAGPRALIDPRAWPSILRAVVVGTAAALAGRAPAPPLAPEGGRLGLPADFLIARDGRVIARKYGEHADDQWSVDELLALAASAA